MGMRWRPDNDPEQISLWLLPSGPDQVGEHSAHRRSPRPISRFEPASARLGLIRTFSGGWKVATGPLSSDRLCAIGRGTLAEKAVSKKRAGLRRAGKACWPRPETGPERWATYCIHGLYRAFQGPPLEEGGFPVWRPPCRKRRLSGRFCPGLVRFSVGSCRVLSGFFLPVWRGGAGQDVSGMARSGGVIIADERGQCLGPAANTEWGAGISASFFLSGPLTPSQAPVSRPGGRRFR